MELVMFNDLNEMEGVGMSSKNPTLVCNKMSTQEGK